MIDKTETIVTAYAEYAAGPGWANRPIWVIVRDQNQKLREVCLQPEHQTADMLALFRVSNAAHLAMTGAVTAWAATKSKARRKAA
jgi:hypothetical protein